MSRRKVRPPRRVQVPIERLHAIVERAASALPEEDHRVLKAAVDTLARVTAELESKNVSLERVLRIVFGPRSETTDQILGREPTTAPSADTAAQERDSALPRTPRKGHGRHGIKDFPKAEHVPIAHATLHHGDPCPEAGCTGTLYTQRKAPARLVRITGVAPFQATVYALERLRCGLCGTVYTACAPEGIGQERHDETVPSLIGLFKYGAGVPFYRLAGLLENLGTPIAAATQWDLVQEAAARVEPAFQEMVCQAAEGRVLYNDDTPSQILKFTAEARAEALPPGASPKRTGTFTSGVVAETPHGPIALFQTGPQHAGEHLAAVLEHRQDPSPPIQMSDALSRNQPGQHATRAASCIPHARRKFVDAASRFPEAVAQVLTELREVFRIDRQAKAQSLSPEARLSLHQRESGPRMQALKQWLDRQFDEHLVEPNSVLGEAIQYMLNHWTKLTLFLREAGAPLSNNLCERVLKKAILHRKNSLFFRTLNGAQVADTFMSLIHTAELHHVEPFDYLVALQRHEAAVSLDPAVWMPWNYTEALARVEDQPATD